MKNTKTARIVTAIMLPVLLSFPSLADEPLFKAPWLTFDVGNDVRPITVDFGDIDNDGDRDVVLALEYFGNPGVSVLLSNGDGTFAPEQIYELVDIVGDARLADFDGDDDLDIFATIPGNAGTDFRVAILKNDGNGTFGTAEYFFAGYGPFGMVVADFTGDGFPDVVTALDGFPGDAIAFLKHNGQTGSNAGFIDSVEFQTGEGSLRVDTADIDGDGDLDLAVGRGHFANGGNHGVSILFNDGTGNFSGLTEYGSLPGAYRDSPAVHLTDIDHDGDPDLIHGASENGFYVYTLIGVRLNDGNGVFGAPQVLTGPEGTFTPWFISSGDFDGDGWTDIVASVGDGRDDDGFLIFSSNGQGGIFPGVFHRAGKWTKDVRGEDVDGDGDHDVVTVASFSAAITVHENPGDGQFFAPPVYWVTDIIRDMKAADFDIDGDLDLVVAGFPILGDPGVYVMRNAGDGTFTREVLVEGISVGNVEFVDLSGDTCPDLLLSPYQNTGFGFWVVISDCDGWFEPITAYPAGGGQGAGVAAVDCNNDGAPDVVLPNTGSQNNCLIFANGGDGRSFTLVNQFGDTISQPGVASADLNHDGNLDVVLNTYAGAATFLGNGDFTFTGPLASGQIISSYELAKIDGDEHLDLVGFVPASYVFTGAFGMSSGYGDGFFGFPVTYPAATDFEFFMDEVTTFDLNDDGFDDVITSNGASSDISIFFNNGDGILQPHDGQRYGVGYQASDAVIADFNNDGILDIACSVNYGDVSVIFGTGGSSAEQIVVADSYTAFRGVHVSGTLEDTLDSDDSYLNYQPGITSSVTEAPVWLVFDGTLPSESPNGLTVTLESFVNTAGLSLTIEMFNWTTNSYEVVDVQSAAANSDSIVTVDLAAGIPDFVQPGTKSVRSRIGWRQTGLVLLFPWTVSIDQVVWTVD